MRGIHPRGHNAEEPALDGLCVPGRTPSEARVEFMNRGFGSHSHEKPLASSARYDLFAYKCRKRFSVALERFSADRVVEVPSRFRTAARYDGVGLMTFATGGC